MLIQAAPTPVPPELSALWLALTAAFATIVTQGLKTVFNPLHNAPDWVKAAIALVLTLGSQIFVRVFGVPLPPDLAGVASVLVSWLAAMGLHRLALLTGVVKPTNQPAR
jgi:hypothetical protein